MDAHVKRMNVPALPIDGLPKLCHYGVMKKPSQMDKERAKKNLAAILEKMRSTDPALINDYRKILKKEISLFRRSWAAAWLFMYYDKKEDPRSGKPGFVHPPEQGRSKKSRGRKEEKCANGAVELSGEESKRLFISIGRNRRLHPREITALISSKTSVSREDIGIIRILDNYSFVQVRDTRADEIIKTLNGLQFRGRTLTVNYAKSKIDENTGGNGN